MPRRKISEFRAKQMVANALHVEYTGWSIVSDVSLKDTLDALDAKALYVVKVDQAVKGRFKKGLVLLGIKKSGLKKAIESLREKGYESFIVEPQVEHDQSAERYLAMTLNRDGTTIAWSEKGGVDIESNQESITSKHLDDKTNWASLAKATKLSADQLQALYAMFQESHVSFMEINPYVSDGGSVKVLDCAMEVDDAGAYFTHAWSEGDTRSPKSGKQYEEVAIVNRLNAKSPASFNLSVLNPDGSVFLLLSGGGASVVVADEVHNQGYGKQLANYGEYSGNPNQQETEQYTSALLSLLLASKSKKKVLFIGGAVANFTDIANTFTGVIAAIDAVADLLREQNVKVFVRRGGPRQEMGLAKIEACLERHGILGSVHTPETPLTEVVRLTLKEIN